jgi:hypothetical protein
MKYKPKAKNVKKLRTYLDKQKSEDKRTKKS